MLENEESTSETAERLCRGSWRILAGNSHLQEMEDIYSGLARQAAVIGQFHSQSMRIDVEEPAFYSVRYGG